MALGGKAMGVIDTIANRQLVKLYQKDSAVFLQVRGGGGGGGEGRGEDGCEHLGVFLSVLGLFSWVEAEDGTVTVLYSDQYKIKPLWQQEEAVQHNIIYLKTF